MLTFGYGVPMTRVPTVGVDCLVNDRRGTRKPYHAWVQPAPRTQSR